MALISMLTNDHMSSVHAELHLAARDIRQPPRPIGGLTADTLPSIFLNPAPLRRAQTSAATQPSRVQPRKRFST
jgi:hypothetical protein